MGEELEILLVASLFHAMETDQDRGTAIENQSQKTETIQEPIKSNTCSWRKLRENVRV